MNIGIDVDGTLTDIWAYMIQNGEKYFGRPASDPNAFDIEQMFACSDKEGHDFWKKYLLKYCLSCPIKDGAVQTINRLRADGHRIFIITSRVSPRPKAKPVYSSGSMPEGWSAHSSAPY